MDGSTPARLPAWLNDIHDFTGRTQSNPLHHHQTNPPPLPPLNHHHHPHHPHQVTLLHRLEGTKARAINKILWSPNGSFLVMANLSESSTLEFYDADSNATLAKRCVLSGVGVDGFVRVGRWMGRWVGVGVGLWVGV
jgi:hypothetical protein